MTCPYTDVRLGGLHKEKRVDLYEISSVMMWTSPKHYLAQVKESDGILVPEPIGGF